MRVIATDTKWEGEAPAEPTDTKWEGEAPAEPTDTKWEGEAPAEPTAGSAGASPSQSDKQPPPQQHFLDDRTAISRRWH